MHLDSWSVGHPKYRVYSPGRPGSSLKLFFEKIPKRIVESAVKNSVVLLSPACASFDQFDNYRKRGEKFKNIVERFYA